MVRLAIIGNGERAAQHQAALAALSDIEVVAVVGPGQEYRDLFSRSELDAIDICTPAGSAVDIAIAAAQAGKRVITEYAPGTSATDVARVEEACREAGVALELLAPERHQPLPRQLKATLEAGQLGAPRYVHSAWIWHWPATEWAASAEWDRAATREDASAFVLDHAAGALDVVGWLFGDVPVYTVFARTCSLPEDGNSRYVSTVLSFADGSQAIVEVGLTSAFPPRTGLQRLALTGMRGSAYFQERDHDILIDGSGARPLADDHTTGLATAFSALFTRESADSVIDAGLAIAAATSLRTGQPVEVGR
jgi:predicted dehydrogenase